MTSTPRISAVLLAALLAAGCEEKSAPPAAGFAPLPGQETKGRPVIDGGRTEVQIDPANPESLYLAGQKEFVDGEFEKAADHLRQSLRLSPNPRAWHALGDALLAQARFTDAAEAFRSAVGLDPKKRLSWMRLGRCLINNGRASEAVEAYGKAIELDPKDANAYREQAEALVAASREEEAIGRLEQAIALDEEGRAADLKLIGQLRSRRSEFPLAVEAFRRSAQLHPDAGIYNELGDALVRAGDLPGARDAFREGARLDEKDPFYWEIVGELETKLGNATAARAAFEASLKIKDRTTPHLGLGRLALSERKRDEAKKQLDAALAVATGEQATEARELARFGAEVGDWAMVEKLLAMLAEEEEGGSKDAALWLELAAARRELKQKEGVEQACAKARALMPKDDKRSCPPAPPTAVGAR